MPKIPRRLFETFPTEVCPFKKHKGKLWKEVAEEDPEYVDWILSFEGPRLTDEQYDYIYNVAEETTEERRF
jgi:hypothetical protein